MVIRMNNCKHKLNAHNNFDPRRVSGFRISILGPENLDIRTIPVVTSCIEKGSMQAQKRFSEGAGVVRAYSRGNPGGILIEGGNRIPIELPRMHGVFAYGDRSQRWAARRGNRHHCGLEHQLHDTIQSRHIVYEQSNERTDRGRQVFVHRPAATVKGKLQP